MNIPYVEGPLSNGRSVEEPLSNTRSTVLALTAGAVVGAAVALVFAPTSGRETRAYLGQRGRTLAGSVAERGKQVWAEHGERVATAVRRGYTEAAHTLTEMNASDATRPS